MRPIEIARVIALLGCGAPCAAQAILVVDANQGPGTQFTDIPPAIAAAAPGDHIIVRPGAYSPFTVDKPLSIVGRGVPGVLITGQDDCVVENLPAGTEVTIRDIVFFSCLLNHCEGRVLIDHCRMFADVNVEACAQVMLNQCPFTNGTVANSSVTMSECKVNGDFFAAAGLVASQSSVFLSRTDVHGDGGLVNTGYGILMSNSQVTVAGDASTISATGLFAGFAAIGGTGTLILDPEVVLWPTPGAPAIEPSVSVQLAELPTLSAAGAPLGGQITVDLRSEPSDLFVLYVGIPATRIPIPAFKGELWIDPASAIGIASGLLDSSGQYNAAFTVPQDLAFVGVALGWIGIAGPTVQSLRLTNNVSHTQSEM